MFNNLILIDDFKVKCNKCGKVYKVNSDSLCFENFYCERPMGIETETVYSGELECKCKNILTYNINVFEYPVDSYDFHYSKSQGCTFLNQPSIKIEYFPDQILSIYEEILSNPSLMHDLEPAEFEEFITNVLYEHGYEAKVTNKTRDGGKDIIAKFEKFGTIYITYFECKHYAPSRPVGVKVVRELYGVLVKDNIDKGVIVTTSYFTKDAIKESKNLNKRIDLIDYEKLCLLIKKDMINDKLRNNDNCF